MRKFLTWSLPLGAGLVLSVVFAWGFVKGLQGDAGELVRESEPAPVTSRSASEEPREKQLIVIIGDSLARGTGDEIGEGIGGRLSTILDEREIEHETANLAVNGARTADVLEQLGRESVRKLVSDASMVILSVGGNDFFGEHESFGPGQRVPERPAEVLEPIQERIGSVVQSIREQNPKATIFILGLYNPFRGAPGGDLFQPLVARWNAELIAAFANDPHVVIVQTADLFLTGNRLSADRFHPGGEAYGLIARRIADTL